MLPHLLPSETISKEKGTADKTVPNLYRITAPHYVSGIVVDSEGTVIRAAPIVEWANGKKLIYVRQYCIEQGYSITLVSPQRRESTLAVIGPLSPDHPPKQLPPLREAYGIGFP